MVFCLIIVVIFIGLGRASWIWLFGVRMLKLSKKAAKGWDHFYGGCWPLKKSSKDFSLAILGGLVWMNG